MSDHDLPGWPTRRLVKRVRSHLWRFGIRPKEPAWSAAWQWANAIANSYYRKHWPLAHEIASQYVLLLLNRMHECRSLRLPYRANEVIPDEVRQLLPATTDVMPTLEQKPKRIKHEKKGSD